LLKGGANSKYDVSLREVDSMRRRIPSHINTNPNLLQDL
jgi:hypothetical protein